MDALNNVIDQAQSAAANFQAPAPIAAPAASAPAMTTAPQRGVGAIAQNIGIIVDTYLSVDEHGMKLSKTMKGHFEDLEVELDFRDVAPVMVFAAGSNTFIKSYNGTNVAPGGESFQAKMQQLQQQFPNQCRGPYQTAEIPMTLLKAYKAPSGGESFDEGLEFGYTPAMMAYREFERLLRDISRDDPSLLEGRVKLKLTHDPRANAKGNAYGVVKYELLGRAD